MRSLYGQRGEDVFGSNAPVHCVVGVAALKDRGTGQSRSRGRIGANPDLPVSTVRGAVVGRVAVADHGKVLEACYSRSQRVGARARCGAGDLYAVFDDKRHVESLELVQVAAQADIRGEGDGCTGGDFLANNAAVWDKRN